MVSKTTSLAGGAVLVLVAALVLFSGNNSGKNATGAFAGYTADVYLSATCGCCQNYIPYLENEGFKVNSKVSNDMNSIKDGLGIPSDMRSCHTVVIGDYFIEGHVPMEAIQKLLDEKPDIDGIALPEMPMGSPGMSGMKTGPFVIYSISDGVSAEFISI